MILISTILKFSALSNFFIVEFYNPLNLDNSIKYFWYFKLCIVVQWESENNGIGRRLLDSSSTLTTPMQERQQFYLKRDLLT